MFGNTVRCCNHIKHITGAPFDISYNLKSVVAGFGNQKAFYAMDKKGCSKDTPQTKDRQVDEWPTHDPPPPMWRPECPREPSPITDPYRIKVPEIVVPQLKGSPAQPAITSIKSNPCGGVPAPPPTPCPPPPRPPFPWIYVWVTSALFVTTGVLYKYWVYLDNIAKSGEYNTIWRPRPKRKRPYHSTDLPPCVQYLIVGGGVAGWSAYQAIKENDKEAKVFFITKEDTYPYKRPPLSSYFLWNLEPPNMNTLRYLIDGKRYSAFYASCNTFMDPVKFYRKQTGPAVAVASGWCVLRIDADDHIAYIKTMCGEQPMSYQRCLLAVGAKAKNLSIFKTAPKDVRDKVCCLRTIRDMEIAYRKVKEAKHVTVIGGGTLGCELAYHLANQHKHIPLEKDEERMQVVHMYKSPGVLSNLLPEYLGEWAAEKLKCEGITIMPKTQPYDAFLSKDGRLEMTLNDGSSFVTDYAFVCVGTKARTELAEPSYLEVDKVNDGILVNTELLARTHLYAAGDAASVYSQRKNTRMRMEHYVNAEEQGYVAGLNMTGYWLPVNFEPTFWFKLGESIQMQVVGEVGACMPIVGLFKPCRAEDLPPRIVEEEGKLPCYKDTAEYKERYKRGLLFYLRDDIVVGLVFWNMPPIEDRLEVATEILRARPSYEEINVLAELLGFPETHCVYLTAEELKEPGPCIKYQAY